jgi:hypothetical protein
MSCQAPWHNLAYRWCWPWRLGTAASEREFSTPCGGLQAVARNVSGSGAFGRWLALLTGCSSSQLFLLSAWRRYSRLTCLPIRLSFNDMRDADVNKAVSVVEFIMAGMLECGDDRKSPWKRDVLSARTIMCQMCHVLVLGTCALPVNPRRG